MEDQAQTTQFAEIQYLMRKVEESNIPEKLKEQANIMLKRVRRMARQGRPSNEYEYIARYIDWCLNIPWFSVSQDNLDLATVKKFMDDMHYGSDPIKQIILEYLSVIKIKMTREKQQSFEPPVLLFNGVHGCGKTSLAKAIAHALGRTFVRIPMGALSASSELRGVPKGNTDAEPGQIIKALVRSKSRNPVILLDEIDKVSGVKAQHYNFMAILLEILDPEQNHSFRDLFIDYPIDLSNAFFICTANTTETITDALLDRVEVIDFPDYTPEEKVIIGRDYLLPRVLEYTKLTPEEVQIDQGSWPFIVEKYGSEAGVRGLEKNIEKFVRKSAMKISTGQGTSVQINKDNIEGFMSEVIPVGGSVPTLQQPVSSQVQEPEESVPAQAQPASFQSQPAPSVTTNLGQQNSAGNDIKPVSPFDSVVGGLPSQQDQNIANMSQNYPTDTLTSVDQQSQTASNLGSTVPKSFEEALLDKADSDDSGSIPPVIFSKPVQPIDIKKPEPEKPNPNLDSVGQSVPVQPPIDGSANTAIKNGIPIATGNESPASQMPQVNLGGGNINN